MKVYDDTLAVSRAYSRISVRNEGWTEGTVLTPHGIVIVYAHGDESHSHHSRLDFIWCGRLYMRNFSGKRYSPRGLARKAREFAETVAKTARPGWAGIRH
ncbi:MAG: hypothetical protein ACOY9J_08630 [Pseudomonadota bacterium]